MESNNELNPEPKPIEENSTEMALSEETAAEAETEAENRSEVIADGRSNLEICPNCLEPNDDDLAVCRYCGMPLHPGAETDPSAMPEDEQTLAQNRAEAVPEKKENKKPQESGFRRVMPWLGLYLIYYAITGCFDIKRQVSLAAEQGQPINEPLAYISQGIWLIAGLLMSWPLIKKGYRKLRHLPEEEETPNTASEAMTEEAAAAAETDTENTEPEAAEETGPAITDDGPQAEEDNE